MMTPLDHGPAHPAEVEDPLVAARHARLGLRIFLVYLALYATFVLAIAFFPGWMPWRPWAEVNLAVWYGFGLIFAAWAVALIYSWLCRGSMNERIRSHAVSSEEQP